MKIRNPHIEIRNKSERPERVKTKARTPHLFFGVSDVLNLFRISIFGFRIFP